MVKKIESYKYIIISILITLLMQCNEALYAQAPTELQIHAPEKTEPMPKFKKEAKATREKPKPMVEKQVVNTDTTTKEKTLIYLDHSDLMRYDENILPDIQVLIGNVILRHDSALLYCDSAYFNQPQNSFDAYGNVRIEQGDSLFVYASTLFYDGNTRIANLYDSVRMINGEVTLTTDTLTYERDLNLGYYLCGGTLRDSLNTLVSQHGYYWADTKMAEFKLEVVGSNDDTQMFSDTLTYNTDTKIATILGPTTIIHEDSTTLYSELGWYDTENDKSQLLKKSVITQPDGKQLKGDTIYYDNNAGLGKAFHNVELIDTTNNITLMGHYGYYQEEGDIALLTDSALMLEYSEEDTVYIHADTLYTYAIGEENMVHAYHNARLYQAEGQGVCDSIKFFSGDSIVYLMQLPILWTDDQQITADTIKMLPELDGYYRMHAVNNATIVQEEDTIHYNQMSGKEIMGFAKDQKLNRLEVLGNAQSIFFPTDDNDIIGMNTIESSYMTIHFKEGKLDRMKVFPTPTAVMYPLDMVDSTMIHLPNFTWQIEVRPKKWEDVFLNPKRYDQKAIDKQRAEIKEQEKETRRNKRKNKNKDIKEDNKQNIQE